VTGPSASQKLGVLIAAATLFSLGHTVDHLLRDDLRWPSAELFFFVLVGLVLYAAIGTGMYLYAKGKVGPGFWAIFAFAGVLLGWAAHFSPFTEQPPSFNLRAYDHALAGWIALGVLSALMLVLAVAGVYAARLWRRGVRASG
jgi:cytochrome c oxidase assembly factor CtaG